MSILSVLIQIFLIIVFMTAYGAASIFITVKLSEICDSESSIPIFFGYFAFTGALLLVGVWYDWSSYVMTKNIVYFWVIGPFIVFILTRKGN